MNAPSSPPLSEHVKSITVVLPSWVGDVVMCSPALRALRTKLPQTQIIGLVRPGLDDLLSGTQWLDQIVNCSMKSVAGLLTAAREIKRSKADAIVLLPNSFRSALAARLSNSSVRIGYARDLRGWMLTHKLRATDRFEPISAVDYYCNLVEWALGTGIPDRRVELRTTEPERAEATRLLHDVPGKLVILNPGANRPDKRWPAERFAAVADHIASQFRVSIVVNGSRGEFGLVNEIARCAKTPIINLAERGVTLGSLKAAIERAALLITNDTGPRHIAAALHTPAVVLFGPTDHRWTTLQCAREHLLLAEPFLPEELVADRVPKACAIEKIAVSDVIAAAERIMSSDAGAGRPTAST